MGLKSDFEVYYEHDNYFLERDSSYLYFMKENLLERINKDMIANNHGKKLIELCKLSDLKIANGRIGTGKSIGSYTCHTPRGSSTIDYAILSMGLFPYIVDFYIDIYDKCLSDVHCPVCIVMSGKKCQL